MSKEQPMRKKITIEESKQMRNKLVYGSERRVVEPSKQSLDFIKSFARVYHAEDNLPEPLSGVCLN